jgi:hypothetical protein
MLRPEVPEQAPAPAVLRQTAVGAARNIGFVLVWAGIVYLLAGWWPGFARVLFWGIGVFVAIRLLCCLFIGIVLPLVAIPLSYLLDTRAIVREGESGPLFLAALIRIVDFSTGVACIATLYHRLYG